MIRVSADSWRRAIATAVLVAFVPLAGGCFGSFNLTRKVYHFNKSISPDKWIRWLAFLGMNIIPVYWFANIVDIFFGNTVEFWTGSNPITVQLEPQKMFGPNGELAMLTPVENGGRLVVSEASGAVHAVTLLREANGVIAAYDDEGRLVGRLVGLDTGAPEIVDLAAAR